jgi:hypothetical protein
LNPACLLFVLAEQDEASTGNVLAEEDDGELRQGAL